MQPTIQFMYKTGDRVQTPLGAPGYIHRIEPVGVYVRVLQPGRDDPRCITPRATIDSLWIFQPQSLTPVMELVCAS